MDIGKSKMSLFFKFFTQNAEYLQLSYILFYFHWKSIKIQFCCLECVQGSQFYHSLMKLKHLLASTSKLSSYVIDND